MTEVRIPVRLTPRAGRDAIDGVGDGVLRARVAVPPVDGAANAALIRLVAATLNVSNGSVRIVGGESSRSKVVAPCSSGSRGSSTSVSSGEAMGVPSLPARALRPR